MFSSLFLPDNLGGGGALIVGAGGAFGKDVLCEDEDFDLYMGWKG